MVFAAAGAPTLGLQHFILRSNALGLYRSFLRTCREAPPHAQGIYLSVYNYVGESERFTAFIPSTLTLAQPCLFELYNNLILFYMHASVELRQHVRQGFEGFRSEQDLNAIKHLLRSGHDQLKILNESLGLSRL